MTDAKRYCGFKGHEHATEEEYQACQDKLQATKPTELTDLFIRNDALPSYPIGQQLMLWVEVREPGDTWKLIEALVDSSKLVAGCGLHSIELVEKQRDIRLY